MVQLSLRGNLKLSKQLKCIKTYEAIKTDNKKFAYDVLFFSFDRKWRQIKNRLQLSKNQIQLLQVGYVSFKKSGRSVNCVIGHLHTNEI